MPNDPIRRRLAALPPPPLPPGLWQNLLARRARQRNRLRGLGVAAGVVLAACALWLAVPFKQLPVASDQPLATTSGTPSATVPATDSDPAIAAIDRALQAAYSRGASDAEIAPLWEIRRQLAARGTPAGSAGQT